MKKLLTTAILLFVSALWLTIMAFATTPTRTTVYSIEGGLARSPHRYKSVKYTWQITASAGLDTLIVGPFDIGGLCHTDSSIDLQMFITAGSINKDSIHWNVDYQLSNDLSPFTGVSDGDSWHLVEQELVAFDSVAYRAGNVLVRLHDKFKPRKYGSHKWFRARFSSDGKTAGRTHEIRATVPIDENLR